MPPASGRKLRAELPILWSFIAIRSYQLNWQTRLLIKLWSDRRGFNMPKQKIRIKLKGFDHKMVDQSAEQIVEAVERTGAVVSGRCLYLPVFRSSVLSAPRL